MKRPLLLALILLPVSLPAHKAYQMDMAAIINEADLVMIAQVTMASSRRETCKTACEYRLAPEWMLKGAFAGKNISFCYSVHFRDEEKGCPGVHYILPPVPRTIGTGQMVIAAFKKDAGASGVLRGSGMFGIGETDAVSSLIKK